MSKKYAYLISKKIAKNPLRIIETLTLIKNNEHYDKDKYCYCDSIKELINICNEKKCSLVSIYNFNQEEFDLILDVIKEYVEVIEIIECNVELSLLEKCSLLKEVYSRDNLKTNMLWDLTCNSLINKLTIMNYPKLKNIDGIKNSALTSLTIKKDHYTVPNVMEIKINDFGIFSTLSNLQELTLFVLENDNKEKDLLDLSKLKNLKSLYIPKDYFTFDQFAWLKSKLENTLNIDCIYYLKKDPANEKVVAIIIGKNEPDWLYDDGTDYEIYHQRYKALKEKYKNLDYPPK